MGIDSDLVLVLVLLSCFMLKLRNRLTDRSSWRTQCRISMYWYSSQQLTTVVRSGFCWFCHSVEGRLSPPHPGPWSFHQEWCDHTPKERTSPSCRDTNVREITRLMFKTCQNFSIILCQPRVHRWGSASCSGYPPGAPRQRYNHAGGIFSTSAAASLWVSGAFQLLGFSLSVSQPWQIRVYAHYAHYAHHTTTYRPNVSCSYRDTVKVSDRVTTGPGGRRLWGRNTWRLCLVNVALIIWQQREH